jgi:class 3 adenylate cyclase
VPAPTTRRSGGSPPLICPGSRSAERAGIGHYAVVTLGPVRFARVGDEWVGYRVMGDGADRTILFLPTLASNVDLVGEFPHMRSFFDGICAFANLLYFDRRGTGVSDGVANAIVPTLEDWADDALAVLDALGLSRVTILAHSLGVAPALLFAAGYPSRVDSLILVQGFARLTSNNGYEIGVPPSARFVDRVVENVAQFWGEGSSFFAVHPELRGDPDFVEFIPRMERSTFGRSAATRAYRTWLTLDVRDAVPSVQAPTLILQGTDTRSPVGAGRWLARELADARLVEYDNEHFDWWFLEGRDVALDAIEEFITGAPPERQPDRVLATVLFVDMVASTERAAELGDRRWRDLLDSFRTAVRKQLHVFRGHEINTRGDDFLVTFDGPARAVRCALAISTAATQVGIAVRAGLHTGEVEVMSDDIAGIAVHIGARIAALAEPGEVLVSRTVVDLVAGSGIAFADRDEHHLKGIPGTWRLFQAADG